MCIRASACASDAAFASAAFFSSAAFCSATSLSISSLLEVKYVCAAYPLTPSPSTFSHPGHTPVSYTHLDVYKRQAQRLSGIFTGKSKLRSDIYRCHIMIDSNHEYTHVLRFSFVSTIFYYDKHFRKESQLRLTMSALPFIISYGRNCGSSLYSSGEI